ncbi:hypothetical protein FRC00_005263 [Tulasnella sp. 408]|nr:hypothetical protein FRC00_005263 [Tulasnella sp. 408]
MSSPALTELKSILSGEIVGPGEEGYDYGIARWSDSCSKPATYVVFPRSAEDVAAAIKFGRSEGLELAICGGGHSWSGASSTTGLVIHLGKYLNAARCDPEERLLYVGGGALWETGGGSNFGVVIEFVLKAHPQRPAVFVTILNFPVSKLEAFIEGVENWFETVTPDEACAFGFTQGGPQPSVSSPDQHKEARVLTEM